MSFHGSPCWYERMVPQGTLEASDAFYAALLGWEIGDAGMEGFTYHLASSEGDMVAGSMEIDPETMGQDMPPNWLVYFAVEDIETTVAKARAAGAAVQAPVATVPGTGRFAILADPDGASFGLLEPEPMEEGPRQGRAFDPRRNGRGNWHELRAQDPERAWMFYSGLFGWTRGEAMPMGPLGTYQLFRFGDEDIGASSPADRRPPVSGCPISGWRASRPQGR